ncbi:DUF2730 family protein [Candidatus Sororendozoicomonas aggregata]|uniref:DUF2730 family protein n=1 Tax=Candidatus Sororendozoicomonas aggregata TaxID=3073239 RepID=UPI002ED4BCBD
MPNEMDYSAARFWWDVLQTVAMIVLFAWTWLENKRKSNTEGLNQLNGSMTTLASRVQRLEDTQALLPTHDEMTAVKNQVAALNEKIEAQNSLLNTIHQFLLNDTRKRGDR